MKNRTLGDIARLAGATLNHPHLAQEPIEQISIDTRTIRLGDVYLPIIGLKLDGHEFIQQALDKGALATFSDRKHAFDDSEIAVLYVDDTTEALQTLAKNYRDELPASVIGITGSNGKTTTKDIVNSVLSVRYRTKKTIGNLNNNIGVPRTLLDLDDDTEVAVVEMGMERFGEIHDLVMMASPDIAVITNVGNVHLDELQTVENVAKAKLEILDNMDETGVFIYNIDNPTLRIAVAERDLPMKVITFGESHDADYVIKPVRSNASGNEFLLNGEPYKVNVLGQVQNYNATVAIIVGKLMGLSDDEIREGLNVEDLTSMRSEMMYCDGFDILNDAYKSNPPSLMESFDTMAMLAGYRRKIAIIGDMLDLGEDAWELHYEVGTKIDPNTVDYLLLYGEMSKAIEEGALTRFPRERVMHFDTKPDLVDQAKYLIIKASLVLVKASRALRMEEVVESLQTITAL